MKRNDTVAFDLLFHLDFQSVRCANFWFFLIHSKRGGGGQTTLTTVHVLRPGRSEHNAQCIWSSSATQIRIAGCMYVIAGLQLQRFALRLSHSAAANIDQILLPILLTSPYAHPRGQVKQYGLYMV
jgi:hypothetical protein